MAEQLAPCLACVRHVRVSELACPFCGAPRAALAPVQLSEEPTGLSRAAILVLGASLALGACDRGSNSAPAPTMVPRNAQPTSDPGSADIYGGPPPPVHSAADAGQGGAAPPAVEVQAYGSPAPPSGPSGSDGGRR